MPRKPEHILDLMEHIRKSIWRSSQTASRVMGFPHVLGSELSIKDMTVPNLRS